MKRRFQRGVKAVAPRRRAELVPVHGAAAELVGKADAVAGIGIVAEDRAAVAIELR